MNLKLNYKRTMIIGFAFFSILMVWQAYNFYCPLYLKTLLNSFLDDDKLKYTEFIIGTIMALDNVLALIMLPIFGRLSDKTKTKYGKRMPYILIGMIATCIVFPFLALCYIWNSLYGLIFTMLLVLIIMNMYRSPAVALMPDLTPKPLRSQANGLINLVGYFGPIVISVVNMLPFLKFTQNEESLVKILAPIFVVLISIIIAVIVLFIKIKENKILDDVKDELAKGEELSLSDNNSLTDEPLSKRDKKNIIILLISVCLWFMAFNAVETFNSTYSDDYYSTYNIVELTEEEFNNDEYYLLNNNEYVLANEYNTNNIYYSKDSGSSIASLGTIILTVSSVITFAVAGIFAVKFGRKLNVMVGIILLILGFILIYILGTGKPSPIIYLYFVMIGIGWALINVNSYPMMVEMSSSKDIGKYTGVYYTASMLAQSLTPILMGGIIAFVPSITLRHLFLYSAIVAILALIVFILFKEDKNKVKQIKSGLSSLDND